MQIHELHTLIDVSYIGYSNIAFHEYLDLFVLFCVECLLLYNFINLNLIYAEI